MLSFFKQALWALLFMSIPLDARSGEDPGAIISEQALRPFMVGRTPQGLVGQNQRTVAAQAKGASERAAAIDGMVDAVITPTFNGSDGNQSFFRFYNLASSWASSASPSVIFPISVLGSPSGRTYGTAEITVAPSASPQYSLADVLARAGASALSAGDTAYSIYIAPTDINAKSAGFEHVIYNSGNGFFEDASMCKAYEWSQSATQKALVNVHSSILSEYPSQVFIHNYQNAAATYQVHITDARNGALIGQINLNTAANASYMVPESFFEQEMKWTPGANQQHLNFFFQDAASSSAPVSAIVGQFIFNQRLAAYINMSASCKVSRG